MKYLFNFLFVLPSILLGQEYYQKNGVEGYILRADIFNDNNYLNPTVNDVECFETKLKEKVSGYYSEFYRQYYSKKIDEKEYLLVKLIHKSLIGKDLKELKNKPFIVIDGCESVRFIVYDIEKQEIIKDVNGGGCGA
ncbi:MAG: hypothetical protein RBT46_03195 [Weeksellaceae bacterium]|jgi:hypothetical protein|nr:hypothetical protein [Weeksellaceae bacterium]MDX9704694.1 hypothetical protein [Weeksellaceae bacterium]